MSAAQIVAVEQLRAHLHRLGAHAQPCCDDCQKNGTTCGGAPAFGAAAVNPIPAPPPPGPFNPITSDWTTKDLLAYTDYVDSRVTAMDRAWADWHDASKWDNGGAGCTPDQITALNAQITAGQITVDQAARACHPEYFDQLDRSNAWSTSFVAGSSLGNGWPTWSQAWHARANQIKDDSVWQQLTEWTASRLPEVQQRQKELAFYVQQAVTIGLKNVPSAGDEPTVDIAPGIPSPSVQGATGFLDSLTGLLVVGGVIAGGVYLIANKKKQ